MSCAFTDKITAETPTEMASDSTDRTDTLPGGRIPPSNTFIACDQEPTILVAADPVYPESARRQGLEARVLVKAFVNVLGQVEAVEVPTADSLENREFVEAARAAAWKTKWKPATRDGEPVAVWVVYHVRFRLEQDQVSGGEGDEHVPPPDTFIAIDQQPQPLDLEPPTYPEEAKKAGIDGQVFVKVFVSKDGEVLQALIMKETPLNVGFGEAAVKAARQGKWKPAIQNGKPVGAWVAYPVRFEMK
jgi:TonB family protein